MILMAVISMAASSCSRLDRNAYSVFKQPEAPAWLPDQWLDYDVGATLVKNGTDTVGPYDVLLTVRHTDAYPGRMLWLAVETTLASGAVSTDTLSLQVASPSGKWLGSGTHSLYTLTDTIARGISPGSAYTVSVAHATRPDSLPGIADIGITLIRTQNNLDK